MHQVTADCLHGRCNECNERVKKISGGSSEGWSAAASGGFGVVGEGVDANADEKNRQRTSGGTASRPQDAAEHRGEHSGVGGSNPSHRTNFFARRIRWREPGGLPECPYFYRWMVDFGWFSIRLHKWVSDDDTRAFHDHPFWFVTVVLRGGYLDISQDPKKLDRGLSAVNVGVSNNELDTFTLSGGGIRIDPLHVGSIRYRPADHRHYVKLTRRPTWSLLVTGPNQRRWSFYRDGKAVKRDKYFAEFGHHPCDGGEPVRMRPDGSRIAR